jgi:5-methylcytosine-specific restriction endonuclease McrA
MRSPVIVPALHADAERRRLEIELAWLEHLGLNSFRRDKATRDALRDRLAEAQNWRCCYCGGRMDGTATDPDAPTFEHVVPRSAGGGDEEGNLAIACRECNMARGSTPLPEWADG